MSKKESEHDRYNRMKKIEKKAYIERKKNIDYYDDDIKRNKKNFKNFVMNSTSMSRDRKSVDIYDEYDYI